MIEAQFLGLNGEKIRLRTLDGNVWELLPERLIPADRDFVQQAIAAKSDVASIGALAIPSGRSEVQINPLKGQVPLPSAHLHGKEVLVTGVGVDPEKALQDAFSRAIEQTVGVLVDAEAVVKNDQLIRDEVLTYSRGYVEKYEIVRRREDGGLHHATIRATVARDKLIQKLKKMKVAMQDVAGEITARQFEFDAKNEEQAAEMLKRTLTGFDMTKLTKVEIVGEPEISRDGSKANVKVSIRLSPDIPRWREFASDLRGVLSRAASKRGAIAWQNGFFGTRELANQLAGEGTLVALFIKASISGDRMDWEIFRVPDPLSYAIKDVKSEMPEIRLVCALLGDADREILRVTVYRSGEPYSGLGQALIGGSAHPLDNFWCLGPIWWGGDAGRDNPHPFGAAARAAPGGPAARDPFGAAAPAEAPGPAARDPFGAAAPAEAPRPAARDPFGAATPEAPRPAARDPFGAATPEAPRPAARDPFGAATPEAPRPAARDPFGAKRDSKSGLIRHTTVTLSVSQEDLKAVRKVTAFLEKATP
jgi:hypothetical protein